MSEVVGDYSAVGRRFAFVVARFNSLVTEPLLRGAQDCLVRHGAALDDLKTVWVPGALEIPLACKLLAQAGGLDGILALGAVIRGETAHFDVVVGQSAAGIARVSYDFSLPVVNAVLTTEDTDQAFARAGTKAGNKGFDAALALMEMAEVAAKLRA
ncbi:MAG: 6,7-dimethyl-8-ribityllumazine synthase [Acidimicrobiales bacterium]